MTVTVPASPHKSARPPGAPPAMALGQLPDGTFVLMKNGAGALDLCRIEYYRDSRMLMLVYAGDAVQEAGRADGFGDGAGADNTVLFPYELPESSAAAIRFAPSILVVEQAASRPLSGYDVPLIQVGL